MPRGSYCVIVAALLVFTCAQAQEDLRLEIISPDKPTFPHEPIMITVRLKNISNRIIEIPDLETAVDLGYHLKITMTDKSGQKLRPQLHVDGAGVDEWPRAQLNPGDEKSINYDLEMRFSPLPGEYAVSAAFDWLKLNASSSKKIVLVEALPENAKKLAELNVSGPETNPKRTSRIKLLTAPIGERSILICQYFGGGNQLMYCCRLGYVSNEIKPSDFEFWQSEKYEFHFVFRAEESSIRDLCIRIFSQCHEPKVYKNMSLEDVVAVVKKSIEEKRPLTDKKK